MKVPLSWLSDYVKPAIPPARLAERLTLAGVEVAGVQAIGVPLPEGMHAKDEAASPVWQRDKIVIGKVLAVERHPNADRLTLATVEYGAAEPKVVVTGAPNICVGESGQKVILALAGSVLYDGHADEKVLRELKPSKIRGVPSDAMVCSAYELGISDEHEGIILLENEAPIGKPAADYLGEIVLDLDVTPNLARCLSMIGVAREVAALTGESLRLPARSQQAAARPGAGPVDIVIENAQLCARYAGLVLEGVKIGPAPGWMQRRLAHAGMRPISNIVDITNYVMLEWGQPLHAFDHDVLLKRAGGRKPVITVRPARKGETLVTLDNNRRELNPDNLVIADSAGPIALAGVMGGAETEVSAATKNILLEAANFDYRSVRRTMKALNLPSEASIRFSRGVHPEMVRPAAERAAELMRAHAGAMPRGGLVDGYPAPVPPRDILLTMSEVRRILGMDFPIEEAKRILQALEFAVEQIGPETLRVRTPPHRLDIQAGSADLIEDLARIHGYDRLPATLLADRLPEQHTNRPLQLEERTRDILVDAGLQEVVTYALTEPSREAPLGLPPADYVRLLNPITSERVVMRHSLLAGMLEVTAANLRHTGEVRIFEIGSVYLAQPGEKLPQEPRRLGLVLTGRRHPEFWGDMAAGQTLPLDFFDLKGIVEALTTDLHLADVSYQPATVSYLHPGKAAELLLHGKPVGSFGVLHPKVGADYALGDRIVLVAQFDLQTMLEAVPERFGYTPVPRFPAALRDIAVIVDEAVPADRVVREIRAAGGDLLAGVRLFDLYRGDSIPTGTKSLAYALSYQALDRTLTDKEVDKAHKKVEDRLKHVLKAQIRGKDLV
jgi:phenylalanyl-tRNA synthetase beta chain